MRKNRSKNQEAWLYTFATPKLDEFANRIAEEIPDIPVIFRQSIDADVTQDLVKPLSLLSKDIPPTTISELKLGSTYFDEQIPSHLTELVSIERSRPTATLSYELLGGFREKVVSTFSSPF